jgi:glycosyltransferase involved in cell wall biosynthesis
MQYKKSAGRLPQFQLTITMPAKKILYISYDGLTDPLGQSQILPYLKGLSAYGYQFTILSFEKPRRFEKEKDLVAKLTKESGIEWVPLTFTSKPPLVAKLYDVIRMKRKAVALHKEKHFDAVHCRSYLSADVGLHLKKKFGVRFFFDMRGFWADEKKDGTWNISNPVFSRVYKYYKNKEAQYLQHADQIISLTHAGKTEMMRWSSYIPFKKPIDVIPCCADMEHFSLTGKDQKRKGRDLLGIEGDLLVISYLGSIGTWYMLDEMLEFFKTVKKKYKDAIFLFLTHSDRTFITGKIFEKELSIEDFIIREASRNEVPVFIKASDINISFIKPVYSKISSSPTKLGEVLSMGIPVIANSGVGDVKEIIEQAHCGYVVDDFTAESLNRAVEAIPGLLVKDPAEIRAAIEKTYSLTNGIQSYLECYKKLFS